MPKTFPPCQTEENNSSTKTLRTGTTNDVRLKPHSCPDSLSSLQEAISTSRQSAFLTTIDNHDVPIRISVARCSSPPSSVARHPRRCQAARTARFTSATRTYALNFTKQIYDITDNGSAFRRLIQTWRVTSVFGVGGRTSTVWHVSHRRLFGTSYKLARVVSTKKSNRQHLSSKTPAYTSSVLWSALLQTGIWNCRFASSTHGQRDTRTDGPNSFTERQNMEKSHGAIVDQMFKGWSDGSKQVVDSNSNLSRHVTMPFV